MQTIDRNTADRNPADQKTADQKTAVSRAVDLARPEIILEIVRCPNCGSLAERCQSALQQKLQCDHCDYLMTTCAQTHRVIEAYAPGLPATRC